MDTIASTKMNSEALTLNADAIPKNKTTRKAGNNDVNIASVSLNCP